METYVITFNCTVQMRQSIEAEGKQEATAFAEAILSGEAGVAAHALRASLDMESLEITEVVEVTRG